MPEDFVSFILVLLVSYSDVQEINRTPELCQIFSCIKSSAVSQPPRNPPPQDWLIADLSGLMRSLERLSLAHLRRIPGYSCWFLCSLPMRQTCQMMMWSTWNRTATTQTRVICKYPVSGSQLSFQHQLSRNFLTSSGSVYPKLAALEIIISQGTEL